MSQADELLENLVKDKEHPTSYTLESEERPHIIVGKDRFITVPSELQKIAVEHDHNVETVTFDCPRYWNGLDMSTMKIFINYMRSDEQTGSYIADNIAVDSVDTSIMHFDWTITEYASYVQGPLRFLVCIKKADDEGNDLNHWNSELNEEMYVSEGLEVDVTSEEPYPDLIMQILTRLDVIEHDVEESVNAELDKKADKNNPEFTGTISLGRKVNSTVGQNSVATGYNVIASGHNSHAEGHTTTASGDNSHAEGFATKAYGYQSHTEGDCTIASGNAQHVQGRCNIDDTENKYAHIVGNGKGNENRSNAHTVDWEGNGWYAGKLTQEGTPTEEKDLATKKYVDEQKTFIAEYGVTTFDEIKDAIDAKKNVIVKYISIVCGLEGIIYGELTSNNVGTVTFGATAYDKSYEFMCDVGRGWLVTEKEIATKDALDKKADKNNPEFTGTMSMGRQKNTTVGENSVAIGSEVVASGAYSHAEGRYTTASGQYSHSEGRYTAASSVYSHAEGLSTRASANCSHAEGRETKASGIYSHTEGSLTEASGTSSHAEGLGAQANGECSHSEGQTSIANGNFSHAEGFGAQANGIYSHSEGNCTIASGKAQHVQGKYNIEDTENKYAHIVGNGINGIHLSNAHTLDWQGNAWFQGAVTSNGADYAEFFEWKDGNPDNEDRVGLLVTLDEEKIRLVETGDEIFGIISGTAAVLGDNYECEWNGKYLTDEFGRVIYDEVEEFVDVVTDIDEETNEPIIEKKSLGIFKHPRINPNYDPKQKYVNRADRPEWDTVGMLGKLYLRDDGTCVVNGYVKAGENGVGTASEEKTNIRVMKRIDVNIIKVLKM